MIPGSQVTDYGRKVADSIPPTNLLFPSLKHSFILAHTDGISLSKPKVQNENRENNHILFECKLYRLEEYKRIYYGMAAFFKYISHSI